MEVDMHPRENVSSKFKVHQQETTEVRVREGVRIYLILQVHLLLNETPGWLIKTPADTAECSGVLQVIIFS